MSPLYCLRLWHGDLKGMCAIFSARGSLVGLLGQQQTGELAAAATCVDLEQDWLVPPGVLPPSLDSRPMASGRFVATAPTPSIWIDPKNPATLSGRRARMISGILGRFLRLSLAPSSPLRDSGIHITARLKEAAKRSLPPRSRVLDAGCGSGSLARALANAGFQVIALDVAPPEALVDPRIECLQADMHVLPIHDSSVDAVFAAFVLEHVTQPVVVLRELIRVTRRAGLLWLAFPVADDPPAAASNRDALFELPFFHLHAFSRTSSEQSWMFDTATLLRTITGCGGRLIAEDEYCESLTATSPSAQGNAGDRVSTTAARWILWTVRSEVRR